MSGFTSGIAAVLRETFAREVLPPPPSARALSPGAAPRRGLLALLLAPEPLPPDLPAAPRRSGPWLAWLFSAEKLDP